MKRLTDLTGKEEGISLPKALKGYEQADFVVQQSARFIYYLSIALIFTMFFLIASTTYLQIANPVYRGPFLPILIPLTTVLFIFVCCYFILIKGYYHFAANLMVFSSMITVWTVMVNDESLGLGRLDTIAYIFSVLTMVPFLVGDKKYLILVYSFLNVIMLFVFMFVFKNQFQVTEAQFRDYIIDITTALVFIGIVGFYVHSINRKAISRAERGIKERMKAEEALKQSEKKYRDTVEFLPQAIYEASTDGVLTYLNKSGLNLFDLKEDDLKNGLKVNALIREKDYLDVNFKKLKSGMTTYGNLYSFVQVDGSIVYMQVYSSPIIEEGVVKGIRGVIVDISDQVKAQETINQSQELFQTLIESAPSVITLSDLEGRYLMVNKAFCIETGISPEMALGRKPEELGIILNKDRFNEVVVDLLNNGHVENVETSIVNRDGRKLDVNYSCNIVHVNNQKALLSSFLNITDRKNSERELEIYRNQLEIKVQERTEELASANEELSAINDDLFLQRQELEKTLEELKNAQQQLVQTEKMASLGVLTAGIAHEINNPLNFIHNGLAVIENHIIEKHPEDKPLLAEVFDAIKTGISRTSNIVKSLNSFSRNDSLPYTNCVIQDILEDCLTMLYSQYKGRIKVIKNYYQLKTYVLANEGKMHQVFLNLLANAIQSIEDHGTIEITVSNGDSKINVIITDSGCGIQAEDISRIFDPFYTTKDPGKGTGLGLSITQNIIHEHMGTIRCVSKVNEGTSFIVSLPINTKNEWS